MINQQCACTCIISTTRYDQFVTNIKVIPFQDTRTQYHGPHPCPFKTYTDDSHRHRSRVLWLYEQPVIYISVRRDHRGCRYCRCLYPIHRSLQPTLLRVFRFLQYTSAIFYISTCLVWSSYINTEPFLFYFLYLYNHIYCHINHSKTMYIFSVLRTNTLKNVLRLSVVTL